MRDAIALNILALTLLAVDLYLIRYLWKKLGCHRKWIPVRASSFLVVAMAVGATTLVSVAMLGPERGLLALEIGLGLTLSLIHPIIAVGYLAANLLVRPWEILPGNTLMMVLPKLLAAIAILSWVLRGLRTSKFHVLWNRATLTFLACIVWFFVAAFFSANAADSLNFLFESLFPVIVLAFLIVNSSDDALDIESLSGVVVISIIGVIAYAIYMTMTDPMYGSGLRLYGIGLTGNANDLAALIAMGLPLLLFSTLLRRRTKLRTFIGFLALAIFMFGLWLSQSRGAILSVGICALVYSLLAARSIRRSFLPAIVLLSVPLILMNLITRDEGETEMSSDSRWHYVETGFAMVKRNPVFGVGPGNYPMLYTQYASVFYEWGQRTAHSSWVLAMAETGFPGLGLFVLLVLTVGLQAWQLRAVYPEYFLSLVSYGTAMSFLSHTYILFPYVLFSLIVAARKVTRPVSSAALVLLVVTCWNTTVAQAESASIRAVSGIEKPLGTFEPETSEQLLLLGSKKETLGFLIKVTGSSCSATTLGFFKGHKTGAMRRFPISLYQMPPIQTNHGSFPDAYVGEHYDPLIPVTDTMLCGGTPKPRWYFGEISIPEDTPADMYQGTLMWERPLPISIEVLPMMIPDVASFPGYTEMTTYWNLLGTYGEWRGNEGDLSGPYVKTLMEHRLYPLTTIVAAPAIVQRKDISVLDFDSSPSAANSISRLNITPRPLGIYMGVPGVSRENVGTKLAEDHLTALENTLKQLSPARKAMIYLWDEPTKEQMPAVKRYAAMVKKFAPSVRVMVTTPYTKDLHDVVDIFAPVMDYVDARGFPNLKEYRAIQHEGKELWWYVSCMSHGCDANMDSGVPDFVLDRPAVYITAIPWLSIRFGVDAFLYYHVNQAFQYYPKRDPWKDLWDFSGNGDGTILYPGRAGERGLSKDQPITSLRLKTWREASYDAEYINWMNRLKAPPQWWPGDYHALLPSIRTWNRDYRAYRRLRDRIAQYVKARMEPGAPS